MEFYLHATHFHGACRFACRPTRTANTCHYRFRWKWLEHCKMVIKATNKTDSTPSVIPSRKVKITAGSRAVSCQGRFPSAERVQRSAEKWMSCWNRWVSERHFYSANCILIAALLLTRALQSAFCMCVRVITFHSFAITSLGNWLIIWCTISHR
jgi:hypothetical protein